MFLLRWVFVVLASFICIFGFVGGYYGNLKLREIGRILSRTVGIHPHVNTIYSLKFYKLRKFWCGELANIIFVMKGTRCKKCCFCLVGNNDKVVCLFIILHNTSLFLTYVNVLHCNLWSHFHSNWLLLTALSVILLMHMPPFHVTVAIQLTYMSFH
jgi:hypothetical protein